MRHKTILRGIPLWIAPSRIWIVAWRLSPTLFRPERAIAEAHRSGFRGDGFRSVVGPSRSSTKRDAPV